MSLSTFSLRSLIILRRRIIWFIPHILGCREACRALCRDAARHPRDAAMPRGIINTRSVNPRGGWRMAVLRDFFFNENQKE